MSIFTRSLCSNHGKKSRAFSSHCFFAATKCILVNASHATREILVFFARCSQFCGSHVKRRGKKTSLLRAFLPQIPGESQQNIYDPTILILLLSAAKLFCLPVRPSRRPLNSACIVRSWHWKMQSEKLFPVFLSNFNRVTINNFPERCVINSRLLSCCHTEID